MKKTIIIFGFINISLLLLLAGLFYLAEANPFRPGDPLFNLQSTAENERIRLTSDPLARAKLSLRLVDRRLDYLTMAADPGQVELAVTALDQCLETAIWNVQALDLDQKDNLAQASDPLLVRMDLTLTGLDHQLNIQAFNTLKGKAIKLLKASQRETVVIKEPRPNIPAAIASKVIPFMDLKVDHGDFRMDGGHAVLECQDCHQDGVYADKPNRCSDCHSFEEELLNITDSNLRQFQIINSANLQHDPGECSDCHTLADWKTLIYEHPNVHECKSCHANDIPKVKVVHPVGNLRTISTKSTTGTVQASTHRYPGDCVDCHSSTDTWSEITYDHHLSTCAGCHSNPSFQNQLPFKLECQRLQTCTECHTDEAHAGKYPGACTNCHTDFKDWKNITVDHTAYPNCSLCHWNKKPVDHYPGLCSNCHSSTSWSEILFKHNPASNCATCHTAPAKHYDGQCNDCHTPAGWRLNVAFHTVSTCANCH
ncbi:MAG TPA: hypothetical protein PJ988_20230, partial [Anaerolinea sp.]|nr:hypothetical protein [Anaerolinea sp.]